MKKISSKTIHLLLIGAVVLFVLLAMTALQRNRRMSKTFESGRFEKVYTSSIDTLHAHTQTIRDKLSANMPGDLEILPEKLLRPSENSDTENSEKPILKDIMLRGIFWSETMPLAEINDRLCKTGDEISGFTVEKIEPYQVILSDPTGTNHTVSIVKDF